MDNEKLKEDTELLDEMPEEEREPIFTVTTTYTEELYTGFSKYIQKNTSTMGWYRIMICIMFLLLAVVGVTSQDWLMAIVAVLAAGLFYFYMEWSINSRIKKAYKASQATHSMESTYAFYDNQYGVLLDTGGEMHVLYESLYEIHEADKAFYILTAPNQGMIIDKSSCTQEQLEFIRNIPVPEKPVDPIIKRQFFKKKGD